MSQEKHFHLYCARNFSEDYGWMSVNTDFIQRSILNEGFIWFLMGDGEWFKTKIAQVPGYLYNFALALNLKNTQHEPAPIH